MTDDPAPPPAAEGPWDRPPSAPPDAIPPPIAPPSPEGSPFTLPVPVPGAAYPPPPRAGSGLGGVNRRIVIIVAVLVAFAVVGLVAEQLARRNSTFTVVSSSSTDGTFSGGDCVSLSATRVTKADCGSAHDAQIIQVIHGSDSCPAGTVEFDVQDGTGNLCLDKGNNAKG